MMPGMPSVRFGAVFYADSVSNQPRQLAPIQDAVFFPAFQAEESIAPQQPVKIICSNAAPSEPGRIAPASVCIALKREIPAFVMYTGPDSGVMSSAYEVYTGKDYKALEEAYRKQEASRERDIPSPAVLASLMTAAPGASRHWH